MSSRSREQELDLQKKSNYIGLGEGRVKIRVHLQVEVASPLEGGIFNRDRQDPVAVGGRKEISVYRNM